jgi:peptidoglycan lytic transglycosylase C
MPTRFITALLIFSLVLAPLSVSAEHAPNASHGKIAASKKLKSAYKLQKKNIQKAFKLYKKKVAKVWGNESVLPDAKHDVTYRNNFKQRSIVDYDQGVVKIEMVVKGRTAKNPKSVQRKLISAVKKTIKQGPDNRSIIEIAKRPTPPRSKQPAVLAGLVANIDNSPLDPSQLVAFAKSIAAEMKTRTLTGKDGKQRTIISTEFRLVPEHIRIRAQKFSGSVYAYAFEHNIPAPLIFAIIETESSFNPRAKSPTPAFGLMQLVPRTGARDAYKFVYSKDKVVKEKYLYNPDNNIQLGAAYLHLLYFKRFRKIKDPQARTLATIAAYNAGPNSVISAFTGRYSKRNYPSRYSWRRHAYKKINKLSAEELYTHFRAHLPSKETRNYLKKVRKRMDKYAADTDPASST